MLEHYSTWQTQYQLRFLIKRNNTPSLGNVYHTKLWREQENNLQQCIIVNNITDIKRNKSSTNTELRIEHSNKSQNDKTLVISTK